VVVIVEAVRMGHYGRQWLVRTQAARTDLLELLEEVEHQARRAQVGRERRRLRQQLVDLLAQLGEELVLRGHFQVCRSALARSAYGDAGGRLAEKATFQALRELRAWRQQRSCAHTQRRCMCTPQRRRQPRAPIVDA
jgi:hypothetical protein